MKPEVIFVILFNFSNTALASSMFDWIYWPNFDNSDSSVSTKEKHIDKVHEDVTLISVPFEELSTEDKFLQEAERFSIVSLSGLDTCEHRVVIKIQASCSALTEEQLAKLSVGLLNCQSEISGRNQVICTDEMSLKECTSSMDNELWNAYHVINNRARAVCYATRQQQFRALSEMAVNKLMSSTLTQLTTMDNLKDLQKELNLLTANSVSSLKEGQAELKDQHSGLRLAQLKVQESIVGNLKQLVQEKSLIQSTQNQLKSFSEKLFREFGDVESQLESQSEQQQNMHEQILSSLTDIMTKIDRVWDAIDKKSQQLLAHQKEMKKSNLETIENLKSVNATVSYLLSLVNILKQEVDHKVIWATNIFGEDQAILLSLMQHFFYFLAGMLLSLFLQLTFVCRLLLLVAVLSNIALLYCYQALSFLPLSSLITVGWLLTLIIPWCWAAFKKRKFTMRHGQESLKTIEEVDKEEDDVSIESSSRLILNNKVNSRSSFFRNHNDEVVFQDTDSLSSSLKNRRSASRERSGSQVVCAAVCRNGQMCRATPTPGHRFCRRHISH